MAQCVIRPEIIFQFKKIKGFFNGLKTGENQDFLEANKFLTKWHTMHRRGVKRLQPTSVSPPENDENDEKSWNYEGFWDVDGFSAYMYILEPHAPDPSPRNDQAAMGSTQKLWSGEFGECQNTVSYVQKNSKQS